MAIIKESKKRLMQHLQKAEKLHDQGELTEAMKEFRKALRLAETKSETEAIQASLKEIKELIGYVSTMEEDEIPLGESLNELFKEHANRIYAVLIASAAVVLLGISVSALSNSYSFDEPEPEPSVNLAEDKVGKGEGHYKENPDYGAHSMATNTKLTIKDSDSRITITLPDEFLAPYPEKYLRDSGELLAAPQSKAALLAPLNRNQKLPIRGVSPDKQWAQAEFEGKLGWVPVALLADERIKSPEEIDKAVREEMGQKYWEIEIQGDQAPYSYFLHVNAPNPQKAGEGLISAYSAYASRQLLEMLNLHAQIRLTRVEAEAAAPVISTDQKSVSVSFRLFSVNQQDKREEIGSKTLVIRQDAVNKRFVLRMPLEGV
ncbi:MAG: hypothetical protein AB7I41_22630 [Candidatus Sericytochromatia bacterium]